MEWQLKFWASAEFKIHNMHLCDLFPWVQSSSPERWHLNTAIHSWFCIMIYNFCISGLHFYFCNRFIAQRGPNFYWNPSLTIYLETTIDFHGSDRHWKRWQWQMWILKSKSIGHAPEKMLMCHNSHCIKSAAKLFYPESISLVKWPEIF